MKPALYAGNVSVPFFQESATELAALCDTGLIQQWQRTWLKR
jgi:hypothetical protein